MRVPGKLKDEVISVFSGADLPARREVSGPLSANSLCSRVSEMQVVPFLSKK